MKNASKKKGMIQSDETSVSSGTMSQFTKSCSRKHIRGNDIMWIQLVTQTFNISGPADVFMFRLISHDRIRWIQPMRAGGNITAKLNF